MSMANTKIKCRKCRGYLMDTTCIISSHHTVLNEDPEVDCEEDKASTVWFLDSDESPEWVKSGIDKGEWSSGKLDCPHCNGRLGSFNFVQPRKCKCLKYVLPPVWMMKSRVDMAVKQSIKMTSSTKSRASVDNTWPIMDHPCPTNQNNNGSTVTEDGNDSLKSDDNFDSPHCLHLTVKQSLESSSDIILPPSTSVKRTKRHQIASEKLFLKKWRKLLHLKKYQDELDASQSKDVNDKYNCPVCMELYFLPMECYPCGHMFCDPCLRCWNKQVKNSKQCPCPICRTPIELTVPNIDVGEKLKKAFPLLYRSRKKLLVKILRPYTAGDFNHQGIGAIYSIVVSVFIYAILFQLFQFVVTE